MPDKRETQGLKSQQVLGENKAHVTQYKPAKGMLSIIKQSIHESASQLDSRHSFSRGESIVYGQQQSRFLKRRQHELETQSKRRRQLKPDLKSIDIACMLSDSKEKRSGSEVKPNELFR